MNDKVEAKIVKNSEKDPDTTLKVQLAHQIKNFFQLRHNGKWVNDKELMKHDRLYEQVFNDLVNKGFIKKRKNNMIYEYKWADGTEKY
jgi:hypothetical protein